MSAWQVRGSSYSPVWSWRGPVSARRRAAGCALALAGGLAACAPPSGGGAHAGAAGVRDVGGCYGAPRGLKVGLPWGGRGH